ncbi:MAG: hypothetical protein ABR505_02605 [Actinomycetota bacterium]
MKELTEPLTDALDNVDHAIHATEMKIQELTARLQALEEERKGLQLALARHQGGKTIVPKPSDDEWLKLNRTDAVEKVLIEAGRPLSPTQIATALREKGRDDTDTYVSAALSYLLRESRVTRIGRAQWIAGRTLMPSLAGPLAAAGVVAAAIAATKGGGKQP